MSKLPILVLDFDGVIHEYSSGWKGAGIVSDGPVDGALTGILNLLDHFEVNILSSRSHQPGGIDAMRSWLRTELYWYFMGDDNTDANDAVYAAMSKIKWPTTKPPAMVTIDDRALTFTGNWADFSVEKLKAFRPWNK